MLNPRKPLLAFTISMRFTILMIVLVMGMGGLYSVSISVLSKALYEHHIENTKKLVDIAYALTESYIKQVEDGQLDIQEAQRRAIKRLREISTDHNSYYWIFTLDGTLILHPTSPELENKNIIAIQDVIGKHVVQDMLNLLNTQNGEAQYSYYWPPNDPKARPKTSYFRMQKKWNWVIGRGDYHHVIEKHKDSIEKELATTMGAIILLAFAASYLLASSISKPIISLNENMQRLAAGDISIDIKEQKRRDEIGDMARTVKIFQTHTESLQKLDTERAENERMKNEFISVVSHELRTPLTSIRGALGLLATVMLKDLPEKIQRTVQIAYKNSERLSLLINDILDIDKIVSGQMQFSLREESLNALLHQAVELNKAYADDFCVRYIYKELRPDTLIYVDASRLLQVLSNLMSNAAKFSPGGGHVDIDSICKEETVTINVRDYGLGIPEEFQNRIFKKFSQADSSATRKKGGTGLGLFISKLLIEQMGGSIGFTTKTGLGTTFWIELPLYTLKQEKKEGSLTLGESITQNRSESL